MTSSAADHREVDIGKPERVVIVEPAEDPVPKEQPATPPEPERDPERVSVPA
ncbi:MAG: hypothetical protein ABR579_03115 [Actinomycetota bacterium]